MHELNKGKRETERETKAWEMLVGNLRWAWYEGQFIRAGGAGGCVSHESGLIAYYYYYCVCIRDMTMVCGYFRKSVCGFVWFFVKC